MHNTEYLGPESSISKEIDEMKYRQKDESFDEKIIVCIIKMIARQENIILMKNISYTNLLIHSNPS